jgi:hypothetical protein
MKKVVKKKSAMKAKVKEVKKVVRKAAKLEKKDLKKTSKAIKATVQGKTKKAARKSGKAESARQERINLLKDNPIARKASTKKRPNKAKGSYK